MSQRHVVVVGGGLAGLSASMKLAEAGVHVYLISMVPVKRSHSVCAQGGINSVNEYTRRQGDSEWLHFDDSVYGGDFLQHQPPVKEMCDWAPRVIDLLDRLGVPFNRTPEGFRDQRRFGGTLFKRTAFAGATTGQQMLYALDEQVRRWEAEGLVEKFEYWEFLGPILDDHGHCRGAVAQDMFSMEIRSLAADALVLATGGCGLIYGRSTMSMICTGGAAARAYKAGVKYANGEFIQVHPTAIPGTDKLRLMSESARGEGGRVWVPRKPQDERDPAAIPAAERYYFLEERYPKYGNLVPRDIATREIFAVCQDGFGIGGGRMVYLDVSHLSDEIKEKLEGILEIYEKFVGEDPREVPMKIFPAVHYSMGGLYTVYTARDDGRGLVHGAPNNMMTNVGGLYAFGEVNYQYHGATRLGANALLSCIFDGLFCGLSVANYVRDEVKARAGSLSASLYDQAVEREQEKVRALLESRGEHNPYEIHQTLGEELTDSCTVLRTEERMRRAHEVLQTLKQQYASVRLADTGSWSNQNLAFTRAVGDMLRYGDAILDAALARTESRGSHYRPDYPQRNDAQWLRTTIAKYDRQNDCPILQWEPVPTPLVPPRSRTYGKVESEQEEKPEPAAS